MLNNLKAAIDVAAKHARASETVAFICSDTYHHDLLDHLWNTKLGPITISKTNGNTYAQWGINGKISFMRDTRQLRGGSYTVIFASPKVLKEERETIGPALDLKLGEPEIYSLFDRAD